MTHNIDYKFNENVMMFFDAKHHKDYDFFRSANFTVEEKLKKILEMMQEQVNNDDYECAHSKSDDLLMLAIDLLCYERGLETLKKILEAYDKVGKWYA